MREKTGVYSTLLDFYPGFNTLLTKLGETLGLTENQVVEMLDFNDPLTQDELLEILVQRQILSQEQKILLLADI